MKRVCPVDGKEISGKNTKVYCSTKCRQEAARTRAIQNKKKVHDTIVESNAIAVSNEIESNLSVAAARISELETEVFTLRSQLLEAQHDLLKEIITCSNAMGAVGLDVPDDIKSHWRDLIVAGDKEYIRHIISGV